MWTSTNFKFPCYYVLIIFSSQLALEVHRLMFKRQTRLPSIVSFSNYLHQGVPYKAENWHALSHEKYFSKHSFLDICRCALKPFKFYNLFPCYICTQPSISFSYLEMILLWGQEQRRIQNPVKQTETELHAKTVNSFSATSVHLPLQTERRIMYKIISQ